MSVRTPIVLGAGAGAVVRDWEWGWGQSPGASGGGGRAARLVALLTTESLSECVPTGTRMLMSGHWKDRFRQWGEGTPFHQQRVLRQPQWPAEPSSRIFLGRRRRKVQAQESSEQHQESPGPPGTLAPDKTHVLTAHRRC